MPHRVLPGRHGPAARSTRSRHGTPGGGAPRAFLQGPPYHAAGALEGLRGVTEYGLSVWDAQSWAAAVGNQVLTVLGEDIPSGRVIEGVRFLNPFADQFDLSDP